MKEQNTKERILEAAEELMLERGFHSVGLKQIVDTVGVPKGSFYYYFDSKDQFGAEMIHHYIGAASARKRKLLLSNELEADPLKRLFDYLDFTVELIQSTPGKFPCLALKLAAEVSGLNELMRNELDSGFEEWIGIFREVFEEAIVQKRLPVDFDSVLEAQMVQDLWAGAVNRSVVKCSEAPIAVAVKHIKTRIDAIVL